MSSTCTNKEPSVYHAVSHPRTDANNDRAAAPKSAVFVVDAGRARVVPVSVAARNGSVAWVRSGVAPGAQVVVYPPATVRDGARVKARKV